MGRIVLAAAADLGNVLFVPRARDAAGFEGLSRSG
jgi:hypothetical protein